MRNMKSQIRGTISGFVFLAAGIGTSIFLCFTIYMYYHAPPAAAYQVVGTCDVIAMITSLIVFFFGIVKRND